VTSPRGEVARKTIHLLLSLVAAATVWWLPPLPAATVLAAATFVALSVELLLRVSRPFATRFHRTLGSLLRPAEGRRLTGATTLSLGYTVAAVALPGLPALAGILFTGVADAGAAVVGRKWGRIRYPGGKSVLGSITFLTLAFGLAVALPGVGVGVAAVAAAGLTVIEAFTLPVDDNLYLPLAGAAVVAVAGGLTAAGIFS
jgi:dolichol kinase